MIGGLKRLIRGETNVDFVGRARTWAVVSGAVILVSLFGLLVLRLNFSLEFEGGSAMTVRIANEAAVPEFNDALAEADVEGTVQIRSAPGGEREALVRTKETDEERLSALQREVAAAAGQTTTGDQPDVNAVSRTTIGPSWGAQITSKAVRGLVVFLVMVSLYISFRFEPKMALGALAALFHDLIATAGVYALVGFEVSPATVIALLTLMGYSLYDTVVVFDRVKENEALLTSTSRTTYSEMVNRSLNEVLMRSINTSISTVLPIAGLLFVGVFLFGAVTLKDLALAMFVGSLVGTYSSIFVATPILAKLKEREPQYQALRRRAEGKAPVAAGARARRAVAQPEPEAAAADPVPVAETSPAPSRPRAQAPRPGTPRPPRKRGGKRRKRR